LCLHLGEQAREYWQQHHTIAAMAADYREAIARAISEPISRPRGLPSHLAADGTALARAIAGSFGVTVDFLSK
jgi:hypothetical protein